MKIVILAQENDNHTAPLKWALERAGVAGPRPPVDS